MDGRSGEGCVEVTVMRVDDDDDAALAERVPPWFVAELVAELTPLRRTVAVLVARSPRLYEDALQETLLRACRSWRSFDPSRPMRPWLRRLAVVSVVELERADRRSGEAACGMQANVSGPGSEDHVAAMDRHRDVRAALGALTPRERALLWHHDVDEQSYRLIASLTGDDAVCLRKAASRARHRFQIAYLARVASRAVVEGGRGCLAAAGTVLVRWRRRLSCRADAACDRLLPLVSASAAMAVATVVVSVPAAVVPVRAAADEPIGGVPVAEAASPVAGVDHPLPPATGRPALPSTPDAGTRSPAAGPTPPMGPAAAKPAAVLRAGPTVTQGAVAVEQSDPTGDTIWYQGVEVRCDRSTVLASTCAVLRATPAGEGAEIGVPRGPGF